jgi:hypothetical protein
MEFVQQLVCSGDLTMAKALRVKILEKHACKQLQATQPILSSLSVSTKQASLLDFKSEQIAEQMTLLDAELFMKIEIPEVLVWAQEQNEERSPNLTRFTEHFNKMSYWARSRILEHRFVEGSEYFPYLTLPLLVPPIYPIAIPNHPFQPFQVSFKLAAQRVKLRYSKLLFTFYRDDDPMVNW